MNIKTKTAWDGNPKAALTLNLQPDLIAEAIQGQAFGARLIHELGEALCQTDKLFSEVQALDNFPVALRGFCRELQKHFEKGGRL